MNCAQCGNPLAPGNAFCPACGTPVAAAASPPPPGYAAPPPPPPQYQQQPPPQYQQPQYQQPQYQQPYPPQPQYQAPAPPPGYQAGYQQPHQVPGQPLPGQQMGGYVPVGGGGWIFAGYLFALLGGLLGIGIGGMLLQSTVKDAYGNKVKKYTGGSRTHGVIIMIIGSIMFAISTQLAG